MTSIRGSDWLPRTTTADDSRFQLYCLPHAGGGAALFHRMRRSFPADVQLAPLRLPGREDRLREPPLESLSELVDVLSDVLARQEGRFGMLGYSLGGLVAFEVARRLREQSTSSPVCLVCVSCRAPHLMADGSQLHQLPDADLLRQTITRYGGDESVLDQDPGLLKYFLPALRADLKMLETYEYQEGAPLEIPVLALRGTADAQISVTDAAAWKQHTEGEFAQRSFPGGHFFFSEDQAAPVDWIARRMSWSAVVDDEA